MKKKVYRILIFLILTAGAPIFAIQVNKAHIAPKRGFVIASVDLKIVFETYPATKKAKEELSRLVLAKENEIAAKRTSVFQKTQEIEKLKIASLESASTGYVSISSITSSTASVSDVMSASSNTSVSETPTSELLARKDSELKTLTQELENLERSSENDLMELDQAKAKTILAKIFLALKELGAERQIDMIVDKSAILWGSPELDLTQELLKKLKGKLIEKE